MGHSLPVALACRYIHANAHRDIGLDDITQAARLSPRGLQYAFRKQLGVTPLGYLREVRLARAHDDLLAEGSAPERHATVNEIARRWFFTHPSRFAATYFAAYGVYPNDELRPAHASGPLARG
ncbi:helix-turn-helix transcriptional regulator [Herbiconiux sp. KACC 21604]|uniref:helix-turn-helix transcriptional regulator n=1 Tax=unclassified Herbiconiux TaxID=2618217 RepID=UPI001C1173B7|nr:helix-turn-helix transcriptional regulator [Herbiconiux sp. SALV-R1]WPO86419.1 helix-turn-helix transcriptional regulator [Herbiconiux sp. KACC 21604]